MEKKVTHDPNLYHDLSQPFASTEEADKAISGFMEDLKEIRKKHKIPDLFVVLMASAKYPDGEIGSFMNHCGYGNSLNQLPMAAYGFGLVKSEQSEMIAKLIAKK